VVLRSGPGRPRWRRRKVFRSGPRILEKSAPPAPEDLNTAELATRTLAELSELGEQLDIEAPDAYPRAELIHRILSAHSSRGGKAFVRGAFYRLVEGFGFLRPPIRSYLPGPNDVYVSAAQIRRFGLRDGDMLSGEIRQPRPGERYFGLADLLEVNGAPATSHPERVDFESLVALHPDRMIRLENDPDDLAARIVDLVAPIGVGQRGLIVAPPRAGKTMMLQSVAHSIMSNHEECYLIVLLIDERPEEVTEMARSVRGEVVSSTFDEPASRHVQVAEMVIEKAKRLAEHKRDVVILLDSITRLARAYNTVMPSSGKVLTGGVDANALQRPKRFFGAARNIEEGGSLTIVATALVDTGSRMDDVIYEEFKGTGNSEIHMERKIAERRIFPSINIDRSGTRREDLLVKAADLQKAWILRKLLAPMEEVAAIEFLIDRLKATKTNAEFFAAMRRQ